MEERGKGRTESASSGAATGLPSYCFPLGANLNLFDHSTPPVTHDSLHRNVTPLPIPSLLWRCSGDRNGAINICQQTVDILSPPTTIYVVRRMPSCFVGPAIPQGALPLRVINFASHQVIILVELHMGPIRTQLAARQLLARHPVPTGR